MPRRKTTPEQQALRKAAKAEARIEKYRAQIDAAHVFEALHGLPPLVGSELQTIWATSLRHQRASAAPDLLALLRTEPAIAASAAFWINTRFAEPQALREQISQAAE